MRCALLVLVVACGGAGNKSTAPPPPPGGGGPPKLGIEPGDGGADKPKGICTADPNDPLGGTCSRGKGVIEDGEMESVGAIDKGVVRKVVREHFEALRYCYEVTLLANPDIAGTVVAKFTIQVDGSVHDVSAAGVHPDVESCVAAKVRGFKFPKPDGAKVEVAYPFTFKPS